MNKILNVCYRVSFVLWLILASGCAGAAMPLPTIHPGQIVPVATNTTLWVMQEAVSGAHNTLRATNGQVWMFARMYPEDGWAFVFLDEAGHFTYNSFVAATGGKGNMTNFSDFEAIKEFLRTNGWKFVEASSVPWALKQAIIQTSAWATALSVSSSVTFFFAVVPFSFQDYLDSFTTPKTMTS